MNFDLFKDITINGQAVVQLSLGGSVVWKKGGEDETAQYFNIEALEDGTIEMQHFGTNATTTMPVLEYSTDKVNWDSWDYSPITINTGNKVYFRGTNTYISSSSSNYSTFSPTCSFKANGNIMSLLYGDDFKGQVSLSGKNNCFYNLFYNSKIVKAPVLPATTLANNCYNKMFNTCTSLTTAPELPATTLATFCYSSMFSACSSLTTVPELPATTLVNYCYYYMFSNCKSLTTAPELPATTLADNCYYGMFAFCSALNTIKCNARYNADGTEITSKIGTSWLNGVPSTGRFFKNPEWSGPTARGNATIPTGWTIVDWIK